MARQQLPMLGKSSIERGISDALIGLYDLAPLVSYQWIEGVKDRRQWLNQIGPVLLLLLFYSSIHLLLYYFSSSSVQSRSVHIYPCPTCKWLIVVSIHLCASAAHWLAHSLEDNPCPMPMTKTPTFLWAAVRWGKAKWQSRHCRSTRQMKHKIAWV